MSSTLNVEGYFRLPKRDRALVDWWIGLHLPDWRRRGVIDFTVRRKSVVFTLVDFEINKSGVRRAKTDGNDIARTRERVPLLTPLPNVGAR